MNNEKTKKLVWAGLFTALTTVATMVVQVPIGSGYGNAGDALVILSAFLLGPAWGALAAGLGSALADLLSGFILYAPGTLIIKALMALAAGAILQASKNSKHIITTVAASVVAEIIMILGYFAYESLILGYGWGALASVFPGNFGQAVFGAIAGTALFFALQRIPYVKNNF